MTIASKANEDMLVPLVDHLKDELREELPGGTFRSTVQVIQPLRLDELVLDLAVPSEIHRRRVTDSMMERMQQLASSYLDRTVQVRVSVAQMRLETENVSGGTVGALTDRRPDSSTIDLRGSAASPATEIPAGAPPAARDASSAQSASAEAASAPTRTSTRVGNPSQRAGLGDHTFENFVIGGSNRFAHAASVAASEAPGEKYTPLFVFGDSGLGKTHLLKAFEHNVQQLFPDKTAMFITTEEYLTQFVAAISSNSVPAFAAKIRRLDVLLIDDIQFISGKSGLQEELFHTLNTLYDLGSQVVISCDSKPDGIDRLEDRLRTRFSQGLVVDIQPPDVETRMAILQALAERIGFWLPGDVAGVIAGRISDNVRSLEGALRQVYARSNLFNESITVDLAENVLGELLPTSEIRISVDLILDVTAEVSGYTKDQLLSGSRKRALVQYRKIAMHLAREMTNHSLAELGSFFDRDHTTVLHAVNSSQDLLAERTEFYQRYMKIQRAIQAQLRAQ